MSNEDNAGKVSANENGDFNKDKKTEDQQPLPFHNPFQPGENKEITQEDIEREQQYKEAMSERD